MIELIVGLYAIILIRAVFVIDAVMKDRDL